MIELLQALWLLIKMLWIVYSSVILAATIAVALMWLLAQA